MTITTLFLDIGGVLLTNGWDQPSRELAAKKFGLDFVELEKRHQLFMSIFEVDKLTLSEYLDKTVFYQKRSFTRTQLRNFMLEQSQPYPEMIELFTQLKAQYGLRIAALSNESRELNAYRIRKFKLGKLMDFFISSCYVHLRKPDADIFRLALDLVQVPLQQILYIEDRPLLLEAAESIGIPSILHTNYESTREKLASFGLRS